MADVEIGLRPLQVEMYRMAFNLYQSLIIRNNAHSLKEDWNHHILPSRFIHEIFRKAIKRIVDDNDFWSDNSNFYEYDCSLNHRISCPSLLTTFAFIISRCSPNRNGDKRSKISLFCSSNRLLLKHWLHWCRYSRGGEWVKLKREQLNHKLSEKSWQKREKHKYHLH